MDAKEKRFLGSNFSSWKVFFVQAILMSLFFALMEVFFHISEGFEINTRFVYPIIFSLPLGFFFASIYSLFPKVVNCILSVVTMIAAVIWVGTQICYASVFDTYMDVAKITMGADVAANFGNEMKDAIITSIPQIVILIIFIMVFALIMFLVIKPKRKTLPVCIAGLLVTVVLHLGCRGMLLIEGDSAYSPANMYKQYPRILDNNMENFGVLTSLRLELSDIIFGNESSSAQEGFRNEDMSLLLGETTTTAPTTVVEQPTSSTSSDKQTETESTVKIEIGTGETSSTSEQETTTVKEPEVVIPVKTKNILDIDMNALISQETNPALKNVHNYVNSLAGSNVNEYTGIFEGYNLIMICAESFSSYMISEELTPTLYKMANGGFSFNNFYGTFWSVTTNGEYAFCTGLMPNTVGKTTELKENSTFMLSADKYLPYCMGNVFNDMGAATFAYHSNYASYYKRGTTHPNMGYRVCRFLDGTYTDGVFSKSEKLVYSGGTSRPNSDEETVLQTLSDYLDNKDENGNVKQFHAYYMTYSGHHPYIDITETGTKNPMVFENRDKVDPLQCANEIKAYIAANLEVENMVTAIVDALTEAGCLENTVIVLTNDHFPYGLVNDTKSIKEMAALTGQTVSDSTFGLYKNAFICYNAGMEEVVEVDTPCCTVDIIPTLLNLFGVEYDSRLLAGTDVLDSNSFHIAMLYNQSFITDKIKYNTSNGKITYLVDKDTVSDAYVNACINYVKNKFDMSLEIISNDYYRVIYDYLAKQNK